MQPVDRRETPPAESGYRLLSLLGLGGWFTAVVPDGEGGVRVIARRLGCRPIERTGPSVADVVTEVFEEAVVAARALRDVA